MAITIRHSTNAALQYNQINSMAPYAMLNTGTNFPFLTEAPNPRTLNRDEQSFLYFLSGTASLDAVLTKKYYDRQGELISETGVTLTGVGIHNSIPINSSVAPDGTFKMCVSLERESSLIPVSETRCYILSESCRGTQVVWLNKLGGYESFYFTGFEVETKTVSRETDIKYPESTHYLSPDRVYASREIKSGKTISLFNRCSNREIAEWLKFDLIDSPDVYVIIDNLYIPVNVVNTSVSSVPYVNNYDVSFSLKYAFDINVQTR